MPDQLAEAGVRRNLIVFAGAGASTESEDVLPSTLYTHVHELLGMGPDDLEKQSPSVTYGPVNDAMYAAELKLLRDWRDIVHAWEHMQ